MGSLKRERDPIANIEGELARLRERVKDLDEKLMLAAAAHDEAISARRMLLVPTARHRASEGGRAFCRSRARVGCYPRRPGSTGRKGQRGRNSSSQRKR